MFIDDLEEEKIDEKVLLLREKFSNLDLPKCPADEHKLQHIYCLWSMTWTNPLIRDQKDYINNLELIADFATIEQWWSIYSHLIRVDCLPPYTELNLFKVGILPMWEDPANIHGGRWMIRIDKENGAQAWEDLCLAFLGEQFSVGNEISGISVSLKKHEVKLTIWNKHCDNNVRIIRIRDTLKRILDYATFNRIEYSMHY